MPEIIVRLGDQEVQRFTIDRDLIIVGRSNKCDIVIENLSVSRRHAEIQRKDGEYYLTDMGSANGSLVNGVRVSHTQIFHDDVIRMGKHDLHFLAPETQDLVPAEAPPSDFEQTIVIGMPAGQGFLTVRSGKQAGSVHTLTTAATQIGRAPDNDIRVLDWFVDPHQAVIGQEGNSFKIRNLAENHPITLNGNSIESKLLKEGDVIQMGTTQVVFTTQLENAEAIKDHRVPEKMTPLPMKIAPGDEKPILAPFEEPEAESLATEEVSPEPAVEEIDETPEPQVQDSDIILGSGHEPETYGASVQDDDSLGELLESPPPDYGAALSAPTSSEDQEMGELLDVDMSEVFDESDEDEVDTYLDTNWDTEEQEDLFATKPDAPAPDEPAMEEASAEPPQESTDEPHEEEFSDQVVDLESFPPIELETDGPEISLEEEPLEEQVPLTEEEEVQQDAEPEEILDEQPPDPEPEEVLKEEPIEEVVVEEEIAEEEGEEEQAAAEETPSDDQSELSETDAKMVVFWEKAMNNPSPAVHKQAAAQLKRLTGRDYD